jgi:hypothetical protein
MDYCVCEFNLGQAYILEESTQTLELGSEVAHQWAIVVGVNRVYLGQANSRKKSQRTQSWNSAVRLSSCQW